MWYKKLNILWLFASINNINNILSNDSKTIYGVSNKANNIVYDDNIICKILLISFSLLTWILSLMFFHFSNDDKVDVIKIILLQNDERDIEIELLLRFYQIYLRSFIATMNDLVWKMCYAKLYQE